MEVQSLDDHKPSPCMKDYHANVDTSRPFRSVKEAVAIFGERFLARKIYPPQKFTIPNQETPHYSPSPLLTHDTQHKYSTSPDGSSIDANDHHRLISDASRELESTLEETKMEVKMMKHRKFETKVTLASLNAELHKNMFKLAPARENAAIKSKKYGEIEDKEEVDEEKQRDSMKTTTLAQRLSIGEEEGSFVGVNKRKDKKVMKNKKIITLIGGLFARKKGPSTTMHNPLFAYSLNQDEQEKCT